MVSIKYVAVWWEEQRVRNRWGWGTGVVRGVQSGAGSWGCRRQEGVLTRLHSPTDATQDIGGVPQLQAVVDAHVHLAGGSEEEKSLGPAHFATLPRAGETEAQSRRGLGKITCPEVLGGAARLGPSTPGSNSPVHSLAH